MSLVVRPAVFADAEQIARLHVETWRQTYAHLLPTDFFGPAHARMRQDMWTRVLRDPHDEWTVRVVEADDSLVGFATSGPAASSDGDDPPRARQLFSLYVDVSRHGAGIGRALLDAVLGDDAALLWVAKQNPRAIAFYMRNGFTFDGEERADPGTPSIEEARMVR
ncbi:GNAT family N-acetyltransferase [Microbacterium marinilacus]|uniref:GNAT family N-acetyltransferase n=1 Tax=Microbacterium marinilacus TaxID=415209 RepID=A0ABP7B2H6_9MICO|nr:GNAT family N-acetyltransferase [Microbacterium marinilacus]MBY0688683.1 GNAT family N-acetyltransferase [Microbacterium marinilacus]